MMQPVRRALRFWTLSDEPEVILAQHREITRQVPLLYSLLIVNTAAVAFTHRLFAPPLLTYVLPVGLCAVCVFRMVKWLLASRRPLSASQVRAQLKRSIIFAGSFGLVAVSWSLSLAQYGGPYEQGHIALYISITVIACIFCLMHLPQAALLGCLLVTGPYLTYYFLQDSSVWTAIALNIGLVSLVMVRVLLNSFKGFVDLVRSQRDMAAQRADAERLSKENARLAMTDSLTGLPNRRFFFSKLEATIELARAKGDIFAVGVFDLDRFKPVNDTYGHVLGDCLLQEVGRRLNEVSDGNTIFARLGGDEFGLILHGNLDQLSAVGASLCKIISEPYEVEGLRVAIGCSSGFAVFPEAGDTAHMLFDRSDYALYHSKTEQRGSCSIFSIEHEVKIKSERAIEVALQEALLEDELDLHIQPIVDLKTMRIVSVEALARWTSPTLGNVPPDQFISLAERYGVIHKVTRILFCKALDILEELPANLTLSFNLSSHDIVTDDTIAFIIAEVERRKSAPERLIFELTETALMRNFQLATRSIRRLRALGAKISLDDFGTGYSSLSYLRRLRIDKVKVDRSFVTNAEGRGKDLLAAIKGLCDNLGLTCVIEGIETPSELRLVRELGYEQAQGYLLGRPQPTAEFHADLETPFAEMLKVIPASRLSSRPT